MGKRGFLSVLAVPAAASALLGGIPAAAAAAAPAVTTAAGGSAAAATGTGTALAGEAGHGYGPLTSALAARLAQNVDDPVIVILKGQPSQAPADSLAGRAVSAAVAASRTSLVDELVRVRATDIKGFTLVNSVAATVSPLEAQRLATDPAVAQVVPDATFTVPGTAGGAPAAASAAAGAVPARAVPARAVPARAVPARAVPAGAASGHRSTSLPLHTVPGACAPAGRSQLAPEGLALTSTASGNVKAPTARSLGFTGTGVKVAFIADGLDPGNVNFKRGNGTSAFADYKDFTGNGPGAPTTGGEAFLDANTIAGQGLVTYNLNGFSAQSYPGTCDIKIQGVAPGASLVGLDVFSGDQSDQLATTTSMFAQAINYAVETDKVNVLNESFGGNPLPDTAQDVIKLFDDAAVKAGVVVSVSSGDAGTASTIGSPATDPNVISVGATTQFQAFAQADIGGARYFAGKGWLSDNVSSFSSAGFDEAGGTVNLVAPGDLSWASCDADTARYSECTNELKKASDLEEAGGTSEAAPFVSGAAALVIQAFRATHAGQTPSPALVKQILLSTATDLGVPAQEQGAGLLDSYQAVQLAESYGRPVRTGSTLLTSAGQLTDVGLPGTVKTWKVTVTNEGASPQTVTAGGRALNPASTSSASGTVSLNDKTSSQYTRDSGSKANYATFTFNVRPGQGRLDVAIAYPANLAAVADPPSLALIDPDGRMAADSEPQGVGNYGNVDVRAPAAGRWTAVVAGVPAKSGGFNGKVAWQATTQDYTSFGSVSPSSLSLAPGQSGSIAVTVRAPSAPGDTAGSVLLHAGGGMTSIPAVVRTEVDVAAGGHFAGVLTGGNGRGELGPDDYYQFTVPPGTNAVRAELALRDNPGMGNIVGAYLVGPDGNVLGYGQNFDLSELRRGATGSTLTATALSPQAGTWTLIVAFGEPVSGQQLSDPFTGSVAFAAAGTVAPAMLQSVGMTDMTLSSGVVHTAAMTITNQSNAPQDYFLDPRLDATATMSLAPVAFAATTPYAPGADKATLPVSADAIPPFYFVPTGTSSVTVRQTSTVPAMTDLSTATGGDPDVGPDALSSASLCGTSVSQAYTPAGGTVTSGAWEPAPTECGPYQKAAPKGSATDTLSVTTAPFDPAVTVATGDYEQLAVSAAAGNKAIDKAVELQPGQSATVNVTFQAPGVPVGLPVRGTLYLDALQISVPPYDQGAGDEVAALPYSYFVVP
jgi:hypothetical protein